jgi:hypothetical protein
VKHTAPTSVERNKKIESNDFYHVENG